MADDIKLDEVLSALDAGLPQAQARLLEFLRIPSISTDPAHDGDVFDAATWCMLLVSTLHPGAGVRLHSRPPLPGGFDESARGGDASW